jgi:hypothetical protein
MPTSKTVRMSLVLDSSGQVVGVSKPSEYRPAKEGEEPVVTAGLAAGLGQSVVEVEVPADLAELQGGELLSRLVEQSSVRAVVANLPTAGGEPSAGGSIVESSQSLPTGAITAGVL